MASKRLGVLNNLLRSLSKEEKEYLLGELKRSIFGGGISQEIKQCPCCGDSSFIRHGSYKGIQKYKCRNTSRIFSYRSKTILSGITNLRKFEQLMSMMVEKSFPTVVEIKDELGISWKYR